MSKRMIAGNWKMNSGQEATGAFFDKLEAWFEFDELGRFASKAIKKGDLEVVIAPPFTSLETAKSSSTSGLIEIAAQNVHHEAKGAFTGEISISMLEEIGCKYVIIGHSERRHIFGESDKFLRRKLMASLESEVLPIFCVGELLEERESGQMKKVLKHQINEAIGDQLTSDIVADMIVIAYEPVWAIGTGKAATDKDADEACGYIREVISSKFGPSTADKIRVLYGGSVNLDNCSELMTQKNIDGLLIGGASLSVDSFSKIIAKTTPGMYRDQK